VADAELDELRQELLYRLRLDLTPQQGFEAFECHQLLAVRFHRAARINGPGVSEAKGWMRFFKEHFPRGDQYAGLLWVRWRIALLKDAYPGPGVAISHGQAHGHWHVVDPGGLLINLESMWDDYEQSIDSMIRTLAADDAPRGVAGVVEGSTLGRAARACPAGLPRRDWCCVGCVRLVQRDGHQALGRFVLNRLRDRDLNGTPRRDWGGRWGGARGEGRLPLGRRGACHTLSAAGTKATVGPNLDTSLRGRSSAFVRESILDPNAAITPGLRKGRDAVHVPEPAHARGRAARRARGRTGRGRWVDAAATTGETARHERFEAGPEAISTGGGRYVDVETQARRPLGKRKQLISRSFVNPSIGLEPMTPPCSPSFVASCDYVGRLAQRSLRGAQSGGRVPATSQSPLER
jgi:hypothetical protein